MPKPDLSHLPLLIRLAIRLGILKPIPVPVEVPAPRRPLKKPPKTRR